MARRAMLVLVDALVLVVRMASRVTVGILAQWAALVFVAKPATKESRAPRVIPATLVPREPRVTLAFVAQRDRKASPARVGSVVPLVPVARSVAMVAVVPLATPAAWDPRAHSVARVSRDRADCVAPLVLLARRATLVNAALVVIRVSWASRDRTDRSATKAFVACRASPASTVSRESVGPVV